MKNVKCLEKIAASRLLTEMGHTINQTDLEAYLSRQVIKASWGDTAMAVVSQMLDAAQVMSSRRGRPTSGHSIVSCGSVKLISSMVGSLFMIGDEPVPHPIDDPIVIKALAWEFMTASAEGRAAPEIKLEAAEAYGANMATIERLLSILDAKRKAKQQPQIESEEILDGEIVEE